MATTFSRRQFVGGLAAALGTAALPSTSSAGAQQGAPARQTQARPRLTLEEYDRAAKLAYNENPYGASEPVVQAMASAARFGNRYNYPDGDILDAIASHHGVARENVLLGAGSSEILQVAGRTFIPGGRKVIGVEPTFTDVYSYASGVRAESIILPLRSDHTQDVAALARAARANHRDAAFVYLCSPNNPTGIVVTKQETNALIDGVPDDVPVLVDEAYHHYVEHPEYATAIPYVREGRNVIVTRTFSKIYGLAGMRLGYAVAPKTLIDRMRPHCTGSINALVKWAGAAALKDVAGVARVRTETLRLRKQTTQALEAMGYAVLPSETNFFMVHLRREVGPVIDAFRARGILVGRPFPPMTQHLRVSVGTAAEMGRFLSAFQEIVPSSSAGGPALSERL
ncbi:MAG TPA: aminotransferase class I/II-fold pyridoxal phosphate-dependent enzyme [Vicinamibacterales bacterium]|nr:aminotransferase class I/II-fold pyridoxal phosphate-dependent enzyme [Vicinamibacterales bacterium]